jgi:hypothetical protein
MMKRYPLPKPCAPQPRVGRVAVFVMCAAAAGGGAFARRAGAEMPLIALCMSGVPEPPYAPLNAAPKVQLWKDASLPALPAPAACLGASSPQSSSTLVAVAGTFQNADGEAALLTRFGAVSRLLLVRYWSTTDHTWRPLLTSATALTQEVDGRPRTDFTAGELESGRDLYQSQTDSRSTNEVIYRMRLRESDSQHFIIETENVTPVRRWGLTLYKPGDLHSLYFVDQRSPGIWTFYSLTRIGGGRWLVLGHENSYINRVVAFYRYFAGIPTDLEPPPAP